MGEIMKLEDWIENDKENKVLAIKELNIDMNKLRKNTSLRKQVTGYIKKKRKRENKFNRFKNVVMEKYSGFDREGLLDVITRLTIENIEKGNEISGLERDIENLDYEVNSLGRHNSSLESSCDSLEKHYDSLFDENSYLTDINNELSDEYNKLSHNYSNLSSDYENLSDDYEELLDEID